MAERTVTKRTKDNGTVVKTVTGKNGGVRKTKTKESGAIKTTRTKDGITTGRTKNAQGRVTSITRRNGKTADKTSVAVKVANKIKNGKGKNALKMQDLAAKKKAARKSGNTEKLAALRKRSAKIRREMKSNVKAKRAAAAE